MEIAGISDGVDGLLDGKSYLIDDRDPWFTAGFVSQLREAG